MGFRNPITSAAAVDTGQPAGAGARVYQGSDPRGVYGVLEFRDGIGDTPAQVIGRANLIPQGGGAYTAQGGSLAIKGGSYNNVTAPELDLNVEGLGGGGYGSIARLSAPDGFYVNGVQQNGDWVYDVLNYGYSATLLAGGFGTIPQGSLSVTVPAGAVLEVEWKAPRIQLGASSEAAFRLQFGTTTADAVDVVNAAGATAATPAQLSGSYVGTGAAVAVVVQALLASGSAAIQNSATGPVRLRHRIR